jgi:hypothetical protein
MKILITAILLGTFSFAQVEEETFYLSPSVFYTNGNYSENVSSSSISFYNSLELFRELYLINHYDYLTISGSDYDYLQQSFLIGGLIDLFPYWVKFNYAHYKGDYDYLPYEYSYNDYTNLYNLDFIYYVDWYYFGMSYTSHNQIGFDNTRSHQLTLRLEKILSDEFFISLKPCFTSLDNGRFLFSSSAKLHYAPLYNLVIKAGGFAGERKFYFDSDLLTIFNQNSIQKYQIVGQIEYSPTFFIKLTAGYQHNKFADFNVDYLYAGIKGIFQITK